MVLTKARLLKHDFPVHGNNFGRDGKSGNWTKHDRNEKAVVDGTSERSLQWTKDPVQDLKENCN